MPKAAPPLPGPDRAAMVLAMRQTLTSALAAMALAALAPIPATAQTPPAPGQPRTAEDLTRDLNSGPPYPVARPATTPPPAEPRPAARPDAGPEPRPMAPAAAPAAANPAAEALTRSLNSGPPAAALPARPAPVRAAEPVPARAPERAPQPAPEPAPRASGPEVRATTPVSPPAAAAPAPTPAPAAQPVATPARPAAAGPAPLDAAARARLPFIVTLPAGTEIVETPSGERFDTWAVRRGETTLVRLYAGPASQFPIYDGEIRNTGGRATVVVADGGARRAMEHLFERDGATPREIHVLVATLTGSDLALAEAIGQSIDPR